MAQNSALGIVFIASLFEFAVAAKDCHSAGSCTNERAFAVAVGVISFFFCMFQLMFVRLGAPAGIVCAKPIGLLLVVLWYGRRPLPCSCHLLFCACLTPEVLFKILPYRLGSWISCLDARTFTDQIYVNRHPTLWFVVGRACSYPSPRSFPWSIGTFTVLLCPRFLVQVSGAGIQHRLKRAISEPVCERKWLLCLVDLLGCLSAVLLQQCIWSPARPAVTI